MREEEKKRTGGVRRCEKREMGVMEKGTGNIFQIAPLTEDAPFTIDPISQ